MPYVNHRWLGGLLTNFQTISLRIKRLHDLERYEAEGQLALLPTRERMAAQADLEKLRANLGGVKNMQRPPDAVFVIDLKTEAIAVKEAQRLRIPIIGLVDTNCDPEGIDFVIPGNDDAIRSCAAITRAIGDVVAEGHGVFRAEEERARRGGRARSAHVEAEERARREAEEKARREAEEKARAEERPPSGRRSGRSGRRPPLRPRPPQRGRSRRGRTAAEAGRRGMPRPRRGAAPSCGCRRSRGRGRRRRPRLRPRRPPHAEQPALRRREPTPRLRRRPPSCAESARGAAAAASRGRRVPDADAAPEPPPRQAPSRRHRRPSSPRRRRRPRRATSEEQA